MNRNRLLFLFLLVSLPWILHGQYLETFSTPNKGYQINFIDDFTSVNWTMTPWATAGGERDATDYFNTTAAGVLESIDLDQEVCWESPLLQIGAAGTVSISVALTWAGFDTDVMAGGCLGDYIKVMYSVNGGAYVMVANQFGGNACATVAYPFGSTPPALGSGTVTQGGISGSTLRIRVCVFTNANAEIVTIDDVSVPQAGVALNCTQPVLSTTVKNIVCNGLASGSIDLTVSGGAGGYTYDWSNDGPENPDNDPQDLINATAGTYTVTVTDAAGCSQTATATIISSPIVQSAVTSPASCNQSNGTIDLSVSGGNPGFTYAWSNGATTQDISGLAAGSYTVTVTDSSVPPCTSTASYMVAALANGPYLESFTVPNKGYLINQVDNFFGVNWTMSPWTLDEPPAGIGRDNGDYFATTAAGKLEGVDSDQEICWISPMFNIASSGTVQFSVDLSWTGFDNEDYILVQYSINGGAFTTIPNVVGGGAGTIQYPFPSVDQNGSITITKTGIIGNKLQIKVCFLTNSQAEIFQMDNVSIPQTVSLCFGPDVTTMNTNVSCFGLNTGSILVTASNATPPYDVSWSGPSSGDPAGTEIAASGGMYTITSLAAGIYSISVTDAAGLVTTVSDTVTQPAAINLTTIQVNVSCNGISNGSIDLTVTGGTSPYTYDWSNDGPENPDNDTQDLSGLAAGIYTVTVTDANGCSGTTSVTITQPTALSLSTTQVNVLCNGSATGSIDLTVSGGTSPYTYDWSNDGPENPDNDTQDITGIVAGTYTVTVTDANGCTSSASATITQPSAIVLTTTQVNLLCNGIPTGSIDLTVSGGVPGYTYDWSNDGAENPDNDPQDLSNLLAGTYTVTVTDANGCTKTTSVTISQPAAIVLTTTQVNVLCNGAATGSVDLTVSGGVPGYTYDWSNDGPENPDNDTQDLSGLTAGTYTVTVTDANGCTTTTNVTITQPLALALTTTQVDVLCNGAATGSIDLTVTGGLFPYFYLWSNGATTQDISGLTQGTYTVTVTDENGCSSTTAATITQPTALNLTTTSIHTCEGQANGSIDLTVTGGTPGYTYDWSNDGPENPDNDTQDLTGLFAGSYTVTVTDANGCFATISQIINNTAVPQVNPVSNQTYCAGSSVPSIVFTSNVQGAVFSWSRTNEAIGLPTNSGMGNIPAFTATNTGTIPLTSTFSVVASFTSNGVTCTGTPIQFTITVNPNPQVSPVASQTYCAGSIVPGVIFASNVPGAVFSWSRTNEPIGLGTNSGMGNVPVFTATNTGTTPITSTFSVVASFTNNGVTCTGTPIQFTITVNPVPQVNAVANQTHCAGSVVPAINFTSSVPGATFSWSRTNEAIGLPTNSGTGPVPSFVATNAGVTPLTATFSVVASFTNNGVTCTGTPIQFTVTINPRPTISPVASQTYCNGSTVPSIVFSSNVPGVVFNWSRTTESIGLAQTSGMGSVPSFIATNNGNAPITSTFTATASYTNNGVTCTSTPITFTITVNPIPLVNPVANQIYCFNTVVPTIVFTSNVPGSVINWTQSGPNIGLTPMSGTGMIPPFNGVNNTNGPLTATFTVIATYTNNGVSCTGPPMTFTITICYQMTPKILGDAYVCPGEIETYSVQNPNPNSTYTWTLQNGGGVILSQTPTTITIQWPDNPGGPFVIQLQEKGCSNVCSGFDFLPVFVQGNEAIACNDHVQISLNEDCEAQVNSSMILEGENEDNDTYFVQLTDPFGNIIPDAVLTADNIGQLIQAMVLNECNGQSCWGTISVEDKILPVITCQDATMPCGSSLEPIYIPPQNGSLTVTHTPGSAIGPNAGTVTTENIDIAAPVGALVTDVNITLDLDHTWSGDLNAKLISPAGTVITLASGLCGAVDNWDYLTFDDAALVAVNAACSNVAPALSGAVRPQEALSAFNGEEAKGTWKLQITDQANADGGTLNVVSLQVTYMQSGPFAAVASDACGDVELTYTDVTSGESCEGQVIYRTWTATDGSGNTATCVQTFNLVPLDLADVVFPAAYVGDCGDSDHPNQTGWPTINGQNLTDQTDICNIFVGYWDKELNDCGGGRKIARTWTVLDWCHAQVVDQVQVIKLSDKTPPVLTCPDNFIVGTDFWYCYANVSVPKPTVSDNCSAITDYELTSSGGTVVAFGNNYVINGLEIGTHTITWWVTDECGNRSSCSFYITVIDDVVPVANCDEHTIVSLTNDGIEGITLVPASVFDDGSYDNCGPVTFRARRMDSCIDFDWTTEGACIDDVPGGIPPVNSRDRGTVHRPCVPFACCDVGAGPIMVELEVTDAAGNKNYCMIEAEVQDKISPFVECPPDIIVSCDFWFNVQEGTFEDEEGNANGNLDEDPLSAVFGNMYDAFANNDDESVRADIIINDPDNEAYGQPHFWGIDGWADDNCKVHLQVRVRVVDDCSGASLPANAPAGAVKLIERRFSAIDDQGNVGTCDHPQRIWVVDYDPFYITDTNCNNADPNDGVIWPCDVLLTNCPEDLGNTGEPTIYDDACSLIGVTYEDTRFDFVDGACYKILREWSVIDWCQYGSDGEGGYNGLWHYTQVIKVHDEQGPDFTNCPSGPVTLCVADPGVSLPDNNQAFLGEDNPNASSCSVHLNLHQTIHETCSDIIHYDVKLYPNNGDEFIYLRTTTTVTVDENNNADLSFDTRQNTIQAIRQNGIPYNSKWCGDYHRILWSAEDGCGNWSHCEYLIRLEDCKQPSPVCINGLSTVVMPIGGQVTIWAKDFNASSFDDCTPEANLLYSFSGDSYQPSYTYTCDNVPAFGVELSVQIWVADEGTDDNCNGQISWNERNKDYCTTTIVITDNAHVCGDTTGSVIAGEVLTEHEQTVANVNVELDYNGQMLSNMMTAQDGYYHFDYQLAHDFIVRAARNDNHKNGVSTLDLVRIQKHLLGIDPFTSPYDLIAADANNSQGVSAIDLVELRKLILGLYSELPNNQSWRFAAERFVFTNPQHPWPFDEQIHVTPEDTAGMSMNFIAIKVGDVNNTAQVNANQILPRNGSGVLHFEAEERTSKAGEPVDLVVRSGDFEGIEGYQFTLETPGLEYTGMEGGAVEMQEENLASLKDRVTVSWHKVGGLNVVPGEVLFTIHFKAVAAGKLQDLVKISSAVTQAEAYDTGDQIKDIFLGFRGVTDEPIFELYQNEPNPFKGSTLIGYKVPEAGPVSLTLFDGTGRILLVKEQDAVKGQNTILISKKELPTLGVLYYRLDAGEYTATKKMVIIE